jgi:Fe-S cluster assembly ATP-binding protein
MLDIKNLSVSFNGEKLLDDINLKIAKGARHMLRGSNGSGKTTLVNAILGNQEYKAHGKIILGGADITDMPTAQRMRRGLFVGMQNVPEIPGLSVMTFLKHSYIAHNGDVPMGEFIKKLKNAQAKLDIPDDWLGRSVNVGFSGGEKKRLMFLHLLILNPKMAVLDEPDSGADADARKKFGDIINEMKSTSFLIISHQDGWFNPTTATTLQNGKIMIK